MAKQQDRLFEAVIGIIILCVGYTVFALMASTTGPVTLYTHTGTVLTDYNQFNTTSPELPNVDLQYKGDASGVVALASGNTTSSAINFSQISSVFYSLPNATWTFTFRCCANVTNKATLLTDVKILYANGTVKKTLGSNVAETSLIAGTDNQTKTSTWTYTYTGTQYGYIPTHNTEYLAVTWKANKTDTTDMQIDVYLAELTTNNTKVALTMYYFIMPSIMTSTIFIVFVVLGFCIIVNAVQGLRKGGKR